MVCVVAPTMADYRVLVIDEQPVFREGLRAVISLDSAFEVVAEADRFAFALDCVRQFRPQLVVSELRVGGDLAQEFVRRAVALDPQIGILIMSSQMGSEDVMGMFSLGICGYLSKESNREEVVSALRAVINGGRYLHPDIARSLLPRPNRTPPTLTQRESEILQGLCEGSTPQQLSAALQLSVSTVRTHMRALYRKYEVRSRTQLVLKALFKPEEE